MSDGNGRVQPDQPAGGRKPHPGRQAGAAKTNALLRLRREQGGLWPGGRPVKHGVRMLEGLLRRGDGLPGTLGQLLADHEAGYLADLGGAEHVSNMETGLVRRLAEGDLFLALVRAQMIGPKGDPKRLPWARLRDVATLHARLADSYKGIAVALGIRRRPQDPTELVIQRYAEPAAPTAAIGTEAPRGSEKTADRSHAHGHSPAAPSGETSSPPEP